MLVSVLLVALFSVVYSQQCESTNTCPTTLGLCPTTALTYQAKCDCQNAALSLNTCSKCLQVTLANAVQCLTWGALSRVGANRTYDFKTCSACSNPPGDNFFPAKCASAMVNFIDNLLPYTRANLLPSIPTVCNALGTYYEELGSCGFQGLTPDVLKNYVCAYSPAPEYQICECGGKGVAPLGTKIMESINNLKAEIVAWINAGRSGSAGTVSFTVRAFACSDRFAIDFSGSYDGAAIRTAIANYLGVNVNRIVVGVGIQDSQVGGTCVGVVATIGKREDSQSTQATIQILNGVSAAVVSQLVVLLCALVFFL